MYFHVGPEGFEPSTNCSAGSHSIQAELWTQHYTTPKPYMCGRQEQVCLGSIRKMGFRHIVI